MEKEYIPYGIEWKKEIKKLPKDTIIDMLAKKGIELNDLMYKNKNCSCNDFTIIDNLFVCKKCGTKHKKLTS